MSREDTNKKKKPHRERKNPHAAEEFKKQRHERNLARGKQRYVAPAIDTSKDTSPAEGEWIREAI